MLDIKASQVYNYSIKQKWTVFQERGNKMKKIFSIILTVAILCLGAIGLTSCGEDSIIVQTNAFFAPFEYYDGTEIVGVDVEIMELVGKKLGKKIEWKDGDFGIIIDTVKEGKLADCGAAGLTITEERAAKVDFPNPYYTSIQYVVVPESSTIATKTAGGVEYVVWNALAGMEVATQTDTTGWIYADAEIDTEGGVLYGTGTTHTPMDTAKVAADALGKTIDVLVIDELPAQYTVENAEGLKCYPLYYQGGEGEADSPVEEQYAICVTKGDTELLDAINEVLEDLLKEDSSGQTKIEKMVMAHMGMDK